MTAAPAEIGIGGSLRELDLRLRLLVDAFRDQLSERARDPFLGLSISDAEVDALLSQAVATESVFASARLDWLTERFGLNAFEREVVLICAAPDLDVRYERLYGYLQDDVTRRRPTVDLLLRLVCPSIEALPAGRAMLAPGGRLARLGVVALDSPPGQASSLSRPVRLEPRIVEYLAGGDDLDARLAPYAHLHPPARGLLPPHAGLQQLLAADGTCVVYLQGPDSAGKSAVARATCASAGRPLLLVDVPDVLAAEPTRVTVLLEAAAREAVLQNAVLAFDGFDRLLADDPELSSVAAAARALLREFPVTALLLGSRRWEPATWLGGSAALRINLAPLAADARFQLWQDHLDGVLPPAALQTLSARYRLVDAPDLQAVAAGARSRALLRGSTDLNVADVRASAKNLATPPLDGLARHVETRYSWDDIVLTPDAVHQLHELCTRITHQALVLETWGYGRKHVRHGGATALFVGPPGTGKSMAAEILAGHLGLELYRIDLSAVVSKYIGETEKNLEKIFSVADRGDVVLLFDEADALFGKRTEVRDAHDRYANVEVAYMLQRLEEFGGLAILTTNLRGNIDEAFLRRLDCVLDFPVPDAAERLQIWRRALAPDTPLADDLDLEFLADRFKLAGGHIRNAALSAAFFAADQKSCVSMRDLVRAIRREYQKLGKLVDESEFGRYGALLRRS